MSDVRRRYRIPLGRCAKCDSDLEARKNGRVYCSGKCVFSRKPHPTGSMPNAGKGE